MASEDIETIMAQLNEMRSEFSETMNGPDGMFVRMDRLEQSQNSRVLWMRVSVGSAITALCAIIADWFSRHFK